MTARMGDRHRADRRGLIGRGLIRLGAALSTATALLLAGCGQTGPLYLPERGEVVTRPAPATTPAPTPAAAPAPTTAPTTAPATPDAPVTAPAVATPPQPSPPVPPKR
jgi:predicted small lipoprotein YifL